MAADRRYRTVRLIKSGGMAEVHEGLIESEGFRRRVAIKWQHALIDNDSWIHRAFADEARIASQLHHPNIVSVIDVGILNDRPFQVLEYVDGIDLFDLLGECRRTNEPFPVAHALRIARAVAEALEYAHEARDHAGRAMKIVHRDVTPANVLLAWTGEIKLLDFGIATASSRLEATRAGMVKGTWQYMSPEQRLGKDVDLRADLFSLGCLLHEMVAGRKLIPTKEVEERLMKGIRPPVDPSLAEDVAKIVTRATEPDRERRSSSAKSMIKRIDRALRSVPPPARGWRSWLQQFKPEREPPKPEGTLAEMFELELVSEASESSLAEFRTISQSLPDWSANSQTVTHTGPTAVDEQRRKPPRSALKKRQSHIPSWMIAVTVTACVVAIASLSYAIWLGAQRKEAKNELASTAPEPAVRALPTAAPEPDEVSKDEAEPEPSPRKSKNRRRPDPIQELSRELGQTLRARGLSLRDLEATPEVEEAIRSWRESSKSRDEKRARAAFDRLVASLDHPELTKRALTQRLSRVKTKLKEASGNLAVSEIRPLESKFLDLSVRASSASSDDERRTLLEEARQLERELSR